MNVDGKGSLVNFHKKVPHQAMLRGDRDFVLEALRQTAAAAPAVAFVAEELLKDAKRRELGQNHGHPFGVGEFTSHSRLYFSGGWDVHWGYGVLTHGQMTVGVMFLDHFWLGHLVRNWLVVSHLTYLAAMA